MDSIFTQHAMTKLHAMNLFNNFFSNFVKNNLTSFTMTYMFVHCSYMKYIDAHIHQGLNLKPHASTPKL